MPNPNSTTPYLSLTQVGQGQLTWDPWINGDLGILDGWASSIGGSVSTLSLNQYHVNSYPISVSLIAGGNITLNGALSTITIIGQNPTGVGISGGNTLNTSGSSSGTIYLQGGNNITLSGTGSTIVISGPTVPVATNFSLNGSSSSVSLVAGAGLGFASNLSTITISFTSVVTNYSSLSGTLAGNTLGAASTTFTVGNTLSISGGGIVSVGGSGGTITISATSAASANVVSSLNASTGQLSISAGANIGIGQANSTITISASSYSTLVTIATAVGAGGTTSGAANTASSSAFQFVAGSNITLSQLSTNPSITIIGPAPTGGAGFTLNGTSSSVSISAGAGIGIGQANSTITVSASVSAAQSVFQMSGNTSGTSSAIQTGTLYLQAVSPMVLSQSTTTGTASTTSNVVSILGPAYSAGANLQVSTTGGTISFAAASAAVTSNVLNALQVSGNTSGTSSLIQTGTLYLQAVSPLGLSQSTTTGTGSTTSNVVSVFGPTYSAGGGLAVSTTAGIVSYSITNHVSSVNGSSGALSISAGAGIGIGQANSTITISASVQTSFVTASAAGNTLSTASVTGTFSNSLVVSAQGIISAAMSTSGNTLILSATTPAVTNFSTISLSASGVTTSSSSGTMNNVLAVSGAGIVSVGVGNGSITVSATTPSVVTSLNGSNGQLSVSAGAGIGIGQANSTITVSASVSAAQSVFQISGNTSGTSSAIATGTLYLQAVSPLLLSQSTTTGTASTTSNVVSIQGPAYSAGAGLAVSTTGGTVSYAATNFVSSVNGSSGALSISAGAGIGIGQANSTITISASVQTSSLSISATGGTLGSLSTSIAISNALNISGAGIVSVGMNGSTITISAPAAAAGTVSLTALGNSTLGSTGTFNSLLNVSGAGIVSVGVGIGSITVSATTPSVVTSLNGSNGSLSIVAGAGISVTGANSTITIQTTSPTLSYTQNFPLAEAGPISIGVIASTGTTAATATNNPFGSSMSLQRILLPFPMNLSEVDLALGISFPASNSGAGSLSQSFQLFSFGNSTSLASVLSASRAVAWASGTTTSGTASSLQQGWQNYNIQPMTFLSTLVPAGEYVVAHLLQWAAVNTSWTISVFGAQALSSLTGASVAPIAASAFTSSASTAVTVFTAAPTNAVVMSNAGTGQVVVFSNAGTAGVTEMRATVTTTASTTGSAAAATVWTATPTAGSRTVFTVAPTAVSALSNAGNAGVSVLSTGGLSAISGWSASTLGTIGSMTTYPFGYNGTFAMTTNTTQATYLSGPFMEGIYNTGGSAAAISLSATAMVETGSLALIQPWFALAGA